MNSNYWKQFYNERTEDYERLTQYEDYEGNLLPALNEIHPLKGTKIIEFGAGAGRITIQLLPLIGNVWAFDISPMMLATAQRKLMPTGRTNWLVGIGDSRAMPIPSDCAEVAIEGWSLVQIATWHIERWRREVEKAVDEMIRVVRPGGVVVAIETLGTGKMEPAPVEKHKAVHDYLARERGFSSTWIRTDYCFPTLRKMQKVMEPIFGKATLETAEESEKGVILPECTGIWWHTV
ncbi:MAG: class I SAM-dependent methyltransferase [Anaerolineales bacterium]|jgi:ubiquinone/menaquinone biosynthesis C-methylase UbiE